MVQKLFQFGAFASWIHPYHHRITSQQAILISLHLLRAQPRMSMWVDPRITKRHYDIQLFHLTNLYELSCVRCQVSSSSRFNSHFRTHYGIWLFHLTKVYELSCVKCLGTNIASLPVYNDRLLYILVQGAYPIYRVYIVVLLSQTVSSFISSKVGAH